MKKVKQTFFALLVLCILVLLGRFLAEIDMVVLSPKGWIGVKQRDLLVIATLLMLIVVIPVFILTFGIAWKYRVGNKKAKYTPEWGHSALAELVWWGVPCIIIIILGTLNWIASYELDPFKPIESKQKPITIQVVALDWKWLFIYPEENIAVVNWVQFPKETPIHFEITADAPMNSFWIPELGGQIFAMPGMKTELHLIANENGDFRGVSANLSGRGFSGMTFVARASSEADFNKWVKTVRRSGTSLTLNEYQTLAKQTENNPVAFYRLKEQNLFNWIVMKDMMPPKERMSHGAK